MPRGNERPEVCTIHPSPPPSPARGEGVGTMPDHAYIAVGANLGDRRANIDAAIGRLRKTPGVRVGKVSSYMDNAAVGGPEGSPAFLNAVVEVETDLPPRELLAALLATEKELGRERRE